MSLIFSFVIWINLNKNLLRLIIFLNECVRLHLFEGVPGVTGSVESLSSDRFSRLSTPTLGRVLLPGPWTPNLVFKAGLFWVESGFEDKLLDEAPRTLDDPDLCPWKRGEDPLVSEAGVPGVPGVMPPMDRRSSSGLGECREFVTGKIIFAFSIKISTTWNR